MRQTCKDARGVDWSCGVAARDRLIALTLRGAVSCKDRGRDRYGRIVALCSGLAANDFGETLVREGLALDYGRRAGTYFKAEREAREFKRGLWAGSFDRPAEVDLLLGDASKAREKLGWSPKVNFEELVARMYESDLKAEQAQLDAGRR